MKNKIYAIGKPIRDVLKVLFTLPVLYIIISYMIPTKPYFTEDINATSTDFSSSFVPIMYPRVQNCRNDTTTIPKLRKAKALTCTMFKDEVGFLAEFVAFYKLQGVDHMILFNHDSTDDFTPEIEPWLSSGFIEIRNTSELLKNPHITEKTEPYWRVMHMKKEQERLCMLWGIKNNYDYQISLDIDEYLFSKEDEKTPKLNLVDQIDDWFDIRQMPTTGVMYIYKASFSPSPHLLEPIDLLTIEAYQTRYPMIGNVNHYMSVQPKVIYRITNPVYTPKTTEFLLKCCGFHGCETNFESRAYCKEAAKSVGRVFGFNGNGFDKDAIGHGLQLNHYARSLEKVFDLFILSF
jgi:hypothetical protein